MRPNSDFRADRKGLVVGVANDQSIAAGCVRAFHASGAEPALTHQSEKVNARAPMHRLTWVEEVGVRACFVSEIARSVTGNTAYIVGGHHVV